MIALTPTHALSPLTLNTGQARRDPNKGQPHDLHKTPAARTATMSSSRELPMPIVSRISSLSQAQATLLHCLTKLIKFTQEQAAAASYAWSPVSMGNERLTFQRWLERWEVAFGAFLSNAMPSMTTEDITLSRVLKSNHLACTILASEQITFDSFDAEFRAIIELAGAVLRSRHATDSPQNTKSRNGAAPSNPSLDVREPLLVVLSRCKQEALRARASELMSSVSS